MCGLGGELRFDSSLTDMVVAVFTTIVTVVGVPLIVILGTCCCCCHVHFKRLQTVLTATPMAAFSLSR